MGIELSLEPDKKHINTATLRSLVANVDFKKLEPEDHQNIVSFLNYAFPNYCSGAGAQLVMKAKKFFESLHGPHPRDGPYALWLAYEQKLYADSPCRKCLLAGLKTV